VPAKMIWAHRPGKKVASVNFIALKEGNQNIDAEYEMNLRMVSGSIPCCHSDPVELPTIALSDLVNHELIQIQATYSNKRRTDCGNYELQHLADCLSLPHRILQIA
jgi:hypothetical protein